MTPCRIVRLSYITAGALLFASCSDNTAHKMSDIDFNRDLCLSEAYDKLGNGNVRGTLTLGPINKEMMRAPGAEIFRAEVERLIVAHNEAAPDGAGKYVIFATPPGKASRHRSAGSAAVICPHDDKANCRNRTVSIFRPVDSPLMARIVFAAALAKHPDMRACYAKRHDK